MKAVRAKPISSVDRNHQGIDQEPRRHPGLAAREPECEINDHRRQEQDREQEGDQDEAEDLGTEPLDPADDPLAERAVVGEDRRFEAELAGAVHPRETIELGRRHSSSPIFRTARKASWGTSTEPTCFIRFLPFFCFSSSLLLRVTSPP